MRKKTGKDQLFDGLAKTIAFLAKPFYLLYKKQVEVKVENTKKEGHELSSFSRNSFHYGKDDDSFSRQNLIYAGAGLFVLAMISVVILLVVPPGEQESLAKHEKDGQKQVAALKNSILSLTEKEKNLKETLFSTIGDCSTVSICGYEIVANNKPVAFVPTKKAADKILTDLKERYVSEEESEIVRSYFEEKVEIKQVYKPIEKGLPFINEEQQLDKIIRGTNEQKRHVVEKGENFWVIAQGYGIPVEDLVQANPDVVPERLQIGQKISLIVPRPLISVCTVEKASYSDPIQYDVKYEDTSNMFQGEYRTKASGSRGERFVNAEIYCRNGLESGRMILSEKITKEPVTKVVYRGIKPPPPRKGTGVFARPTSRGYITSGFGWRWGRKHAGIDIGVKIGTPIKASDGGVVTFSGTKGGYGRCVIINHGANMSTLYAHNSKLYVRKGEKVFKGQTIAASGNTGRSTGPHLHFEIRKNNVPLNPIKYVSY